MGKASSTLRPGTTDRTPMSKRLYIHEVATRDGFQIEAAFVPTEAKIALIDRLSQTGLAKVEVTSFTSPKAIPNLRDAEAVMRAIRPVEGYEYNVLVPNVKGCERAIACEVKSDERRVGRVWVHRGRIR